LQAKLKVKTFLRGHLPPTEARTFLEGLFIGQFHDPILADNLRRFGLSHIMVVSGFHFSLIATFGACLLRVFSSWKGRILALAVATTCYLLFIGVTASVMRAWVSVFIVLLGALFERKANGLNSLGLGLIALLVYEPTLCLSLGFQLSFLATAAILFFYPLCDQLLQRPFQTRSASCVLEMPALEQITYLLMIFFRKAWALGIAVNIVMVPMGFYVFGTFPLMSLLYNSFFPFLTAICLFLLCLSCLFFWVPVVADGLFWLCHFVTESMLTTVSYMPRSLDVMVTTSEVSHMAIVLYLSLALFFAVWQHSRQYAEIESSKLFSYI